MSVLNKSGKPTTNLQIILEHPSKVFFSGDIITGSVKFQIEPYYKIQILSTNLNAEYYYTKDGQENVELIYTELSATDVQSAGDGNSEMSFALIIRPHSPTSLDTLLGGIRYRVVAVLLYKNENKIFNVEASELVSVNLKKQLTNDMVGQKVSGQQGWNQPACCCRSISADFEVTCVALLCGHNASINACINNGRNVFIQGTSVTLVQKVVRQRDKKAIKRNVSSKERGAILPFKRQVWLSERFLIPPLPPSTADTYFLVSYKFVLTVHRNSMKGMSLKIPIAIANLPREKDTERSFNSQCNIEGEIAAMTEGLSANDSAGFQPLYVTYVS